MIKTIILTLIVIALVALGASIGLIFKRRPLQGSCGGLTALGFQKACACKEPCDKALEAEATAKFLEAKEAGEVKKVESVSNPDLPYAQQRTGEGKYHSGQ